MKLKKSLSQNQRLHGTVRWSAKSVNRLMSSASSSPIRYVWVCRRIFLSLLTFYRTKDWSLWSSTTLMAKAAAFWLIPWVSENLCRYDAEIVVFLPWNNTSDLRSSPTCTLCGEKSPRCGRWSWHQQDWSRTGITKSNSGELTIFQNKIDYGLVVLFIINYCVS